MIPSETMDLEEASSRTFQLSVVIGADCETT